MATLKKEYSDRPAKITDLEAIVELFNNYWEPLGVRLTTTNLFRALLTAPGFDIESSTRVVLAGDSRIVGWIIMPPAVHPSVQGCVHPDFEGQGIGQYLVEWAEQRARRAIAEVSEGIRVSMQLTASNTHEPTKRLFEKLGLTAIRHSHVMEITLDDTSYEAKWPDGIVVTTYH